jgi:hypothetical protein
MADIAMFICDEKLDDCDEKLGDDIEITNVDIVNNDNIDIDNIDNIDNSYFPSFANNGDVSLVELFA